VGEVRWRAAADPFTFLPAGVLIVEPPGLAGVFDCASNGTEIPITIRTAKIVFGMIFNGVLLRSSTLASVRTINPELRSYQNSGQNSGIMPDLAVRSR